MGKLKLLMWAIFEAADAICTTPSLSCKSPFKEWKETRAKGIAVEGAGSISRPDLNSVWGNTLLPCVIAGDDKQLSPSVVTDDRDQDKDGNMLNRFAPEGKVSPLLFFKSMGWPIFQLHTQLRMATGLFDICRREFYSTVPFQYSIDCNINLPRYKIGRQLESFMQQKYRTMVPAPRGQLLPIFIHCPNSWCTINQSTGSKQNPGQVRIALQLLNVFVRKEQVDACDIAIITPDYANVRLIKSDLESSKYLALSKMRPAVTIDFQGQEADIIAVIFGTTKESGPGYTTDKGRLNVIFSRQKSGLLVFGDINVLRPLDTDFGTSSREATGYYSNPKNKPVRERKAGKLVYYQATTLKSILDHFVRSGRMVCIEGPVIGRDVAIPQSAQRPVIRWK